MKVKQVFVLVIFFCFFYNTSFASVYNIYFDTILEFITGGKKKPEPTEVLQEKVVKIELEEFKNEDENENQNDEVNIFLNSEDEYVEEKEEEEKQEKKEPTAERKEEPKTALGKLLDSIVSRLSGVKANETNQQISGTNFSANTGPQLSPTSGSNIPTQTPFLNSLLGGNQSTQQSPTRPYSVPDSVARYTPTGTQREATPYNGPGGSLPGECGIPKGPWAYNIGGNSVSCSAEVTVTGFKSQLRGKFGAGYINPLTEKGQARPGSAAGNCADSFTAKQYGEGCFSSYASGAGQAYIQEQLLHWQQQGAAKGQKCVPVDIDNCDSIGSANYKNILDQVENFNNQAEVKIKVLTKNPHLGGCNFFSHPAVVGAFIEEISPSDAQRVSQMRNKPEQVLLFARGGGGTNQKLKQIESLKISNSAYSYDEGGEYENVTNCTYNP